jgi:hypothetical protein
MNAHSENFPAILDTLANAMHRACYVGGNVSKVHRLYAQAALDVFCDLLETQEVLGVMSIAYTNAHLQTCCLSSLKTALTTLTKHLKEE